MPKWPPLGLLPLLPPPKLRAGAWLPPPKLREGAEPPLPKLPPERVEGTPMELLGAEELPPPNERVLPLLFGVKVRLGADEEKRLPKELLLGRVTVARVLLWRLLPSNVRLLLPKLRLPPPNVRSLGVIEPPKVRGALLPLLLPKERGRPCGCVPKRLPLPKERLPCVPKRVPRPKSPRLNPSRMPMRSMPLRGPPKLRPWYQLRPPFMYQLWPPR